jgi:hypothetical protein
MLHIEYLSTYHQSFPLQNLRSLIPVLYYRHQTDFVLQLCCLTFRNNISTTDVLKLIPLGSSHSCHVGIIDGSKLETIKVGWPAVS